MTRVTTAFALFATFMACHMATDDVTPAEARRAESESDTRAKRVSIDVDEMSREAMGELAAHIESLGAIESAQVKIMEDGDGHVQMVVTIAGKDLPSNDDLVQELQSFEGLQDASVAVENIHPDEVTFGAGKLDPDQSPEEIEPEVTARLRAQGVKGDIAVNVVDADGERRVEVSVEDHAGNGPGSPPDRASGPSAPAPKAAN